MTREEAIDRLKTCVADIDDKNLDATSQALKIAIKALEQESVLDKIKENFIARYPRNYAGGLELGGRSCVFSLNDILHTIDKYKAESEE